MAQITRMKGEKRGIRNVGAMPPCPPENARYKGGSRIKRMARRKGEKASSVCRGDAHTIAFRLRHLRIVFGAAGWGLTTDH